MGSYQNRKYAELYFLSLLIYTAQTYHALKEYVLMKSPQRIQEL